MGDTRANHKRPRRAGEAATDFINDAGSNNSILANARRLIENTRFIATAALVILAALAWPIAALTGPHPCPGPLDYLKHLPRICEPPPPPHYAIYDYITTDPHRPPRHHGHDTDAPLDITDGTPTATIEAMLPPAGRTHEIAATTTPNWHRETWTWHGIQISIEVHDLSHATRNVSVTRLTGPYYIAVVPAVLLGESTLQDVTDSRIYGAISKIDFSEHPPSNDASADMHAVLAAHLPLTDGHAYLLTVTMGFGYRPPDPPARLKRDSEPCAHASIDAIQFRPHTPQRPSEPTEHSCLKPPIIIEEQGGRTYEFWSTDITPQQPTQKPHS